MTAISEHSGSNRGPQDIDSLRKLLGVCCRGGPHALDECRAIYDVSVVRCAMES